MKNLLWMCALLLVLPSCQSLRNLRSADSFNDASRDYIVMVRWHEFDKALLTFADKSVREEFGQRVAAAANVNVVDYRVRSMECQPEKGEAEVTVEWDYYLPPSVRVKTVVDPQRWSYVEENGGSRWVLKTLLPEFK